MAYIQKITPPPNKIYNFSLKDFSGGLNNASNQLNDNEARNLINMMFCDDTLMEKRKGQEYYDDLDISYIPEPPENPEEPSEEPSTDVLFIDEYRPYKDTDKLIRATNKKMYVGNDEIATLSGEMCGANFQDKYIFADGTKIYAYGKFPQESTSPYVVVEGTAVDDCVVMEVVSPADGHTQLDTSHVKGVTRYNYTDKTICYEPCENEFKDTYKGACKVPENIKYVVSHNGRLFLSGNNKDDDNVFISDINNPFYYPTALPMQLPPNSDKVIGLHVYDDGVVVGRSNDIYIIYGSTNNPGLGMEVFQLKKLNTHTGFANHKAVDVVNNYLFFLGSDGNAYGLITSKYDSKSLITTNISQQLDLFKEPISLSKSDINEACSIFFDDMWYLSIKDKVLIYSYNQRGWTMWTSLNARSFYKLNGELIWGNSSGRIVKHPENTYLDFGQPYQAFWYSKRFDMDEPNTFKQFRDFFMIAHVYSDKKSDINILYEIDYSDVKNRILVQQQLSTWGNSVFGDRFINRNIAETLPLTIGQRGRNLSFKFTNGYYTKGEVATVDDLNAVLGKKDGLLVKVVDTSSYYLYTNYEWKKMSVDDLDQRMKIYQVNGDYELRGKR